MVSSTVECRGSISIASVQVEVSPHDCDGRLHTSLRILQCLLQLSQPEGVVPFAFEVQVVAHECFAIDPYFANEGDPPTEPSLEKFDLGYIPTGFPEA
jgi:hypothetical protein